MVAAQEKGKKSKKTGTGKKIKGKKSKSKTKGVKREAHLKQTPSGAGG
jgi:hypothetical protein